MNPTQSAPTNFGAFFSTTNNGNEIKIQNVFEKGGANANEFKPNPKRGTNGVYEAVIRFLPNPIDPVNKSLIQKFSCYIKDPRNGTGRYLDDPRTIGQSSIISNTFFALRNSADPVLKEASAQFSSKLNIYALIQVLSCKSEPQLENKILVWRFGQKIMEKIQAEMYPPMGVGHTPFNLLDGRPFAIRVKEVSGFPNYDSCAFFDLPLANSGFRVMTTDATGQQKLTVVTAESVATPEAQQTVFEYLKNTAPDMSAYDFKPWTPEDTAFVNEMVMLYSNRNAIVSAQQQNVQPFGTPQPAAPTQPGFGMNAAANNFTPPTASSTPVTPGFGNVQQPASPNVFGANPLTPDMSAIEAVSSAPASHSAANAPVAGLNLDDILAGTMI